VSTYQNNKWINIPYSDLQAKDIGHVNINPSNTDEVFLSSAHNGLLKLQNNQVVAHYDYTNSPLVDVDPHGTYRSTRVFATAFDKQNNLWLTQRGGVKLLELKTDGTWVNTSVNSVIQSSLSLGFNELVTDKEDNLWMATEAKGVVGYNPNTGQSVSVIEGITNSSYTNVTALAVDKDGIMWMGNHEELRILNNPEKAFENPDLVFKPIKIVYQGVVQLLMNGQNIASIKVDGSNNKWMGTLGSGAYYFNEDGTQLIYHFTKDNSPLPSNDVYDIAIDGKTGLVYFATGNGLIAYKGLATDAGENMDDVYAFPNPVNLQNDNFVTIRGLIEDVSVKIVDVEGNLVYETISKGGSISWNLTAFNKYKVASGVYIALITNDDGTVTQTTKILVIK